MNAIRNAYVAGQFYSENSSKLRSEIKSMRANAEALYDEKPELKNRISSINGMKNPYIGIILPHAGYMYSGQTAVNTVFAVKECKFTKIMVIAPSHRSMFSGIATVTEYTAFDTPLGYIPVDKKSVENILAEKNSLIKDSAEVHKYEHSLEVELPILKEFFPNIELIPFICGNITIHDAINIADTLTKYWTPETLVVISSDFTHYGAAFSYMPFMSNIPENLKKLDGKAIEKILNIDMQGFSCYLRKTGATICGSKPIKILLGMLDISRKHFQVSWKPWLIEYITSGDLTGDYNHTVSYAGIVFAGEIP